MRKNRIVYIALLVGSIVLVSYQGGMVSYALFHLCLCTPIVALAYIVFVYMKLQFYQNTAQRIVKKEEVIPYEVILRNQTHIPFAHIKVKFYEAQCKVEDSEKIIEYCLLPGEEKKLQTTLKCYYRGEHSVGVKQIEIMDFFYLFKITYPARWSLSLTVLPRVIKLNRLGIVSNNENFKCQYKKNTENIRLESDTRKYQVGDSLKQIHWKVVARQGELFTRRTSTEMNLEYIILMDCSRVEQESYTRLAIEDQIIESVLAIASYLQSIQAKVKVCYEAEGIREHSITTHEAFGAFYQISSKIYFNAAKSLPILLNTYLLQNTGFNCYVLVTSKFSEKLYEVAMQALAYGQKVVILYVANLLTTDEKTFMSRLETIGIKVYWIKPGDSLEKIIG